MKTIPSILVQVLFSLGLFALLSYTPLALAHGGEDHGDGAASVVTSQPLAPRAEAKSEDVELLAVYADKVLTLYVSRFATNEPLANAQIDIESGSQKASAKPVADGVYRVAAPWLTNPGKYDLVATIQGKDVNDLLETSLEIKHAQEGRQSERMAGVAPAGMLGAVGGIVLIGLVAFGLRRRKK